MPKKVSPKCFIQLCQKGKHIAQRKKERYIRAQVKGTGILNTLADTVSRLIEMDENIKLQPEEDGKEFGYFTFEELPPVTTQVVEEVIE